MRSRHGKKLWESLPKAVLEVIRPAPPTTPQKRVGVCVDCGSGGIRVWQITFGNFGPEFNKLRCPNKPPPIAHCCATPEGRSMFAKFIETLPKPCFIGATAGVRYAIEQSKELKEEDVEALRRLLPDGCVLSVLTGEEEGRYELRSLQQQHAAR